jgi:urea transport system ATP-binding protein
MSTTEIEAHPASASEPPRPRRTTPFRLRRSGGKVDEERANRVRGSREKALLCVDNISVSFDGFQALTNLTLVLGEGELRCIIGPNGAGKTTLMDVVTGKTRPDEGHVFFFSDLEDLTGLPEHEIARRGIGRKFQRPTVFPHHTVRENLELALASGKGVWRSLFSTFSKAEAARVDEVLETIRLQDLLKVPAGGLAHGQKQWLEIGMLLAQEPKLLLVDEPVAGMTDAETRQTAELLKEINREKTVIVVEHDMTFVRDLGVKVTVLHEGTVIAEGSIDQVSADERVVEVYLGR